MITNTKHFLPILFAIFALFLAAGAHLSLAPITHAQDVRTGQIPGAEADVAEVVVPGEDRPPVDIPTNLQAGTAGDGLFNKMIHKIMGLFAKLVYVAMIILDGAVYYTVVTMGSVVQNLAPVGLTWQIMRDIGNIMLIFGFLAIGITTILNTEQFGYKKMLPKLLIAAVFLNFSLFIAKAIIDTGNLFAAQIYTQINEGRPAGDGGREAVSSAIMGSIALQEIYNVHTGELKILERDNPWYVGFLGIVLFMITAFVMLTIAFILIARFVILLLLIIISPIGFAGLAIPQLEGHAKKWWSTLFTQTLTAPALLLMLYIALRIITEPTFFSGFGARDPNWTGILAGQGQMAVNFAGTILSFIIAMGLLLAVIMVSKSMSAFGGGLATKWAGRLSTAPAATGLGWVGRNSAGRLAKFSARKLNEKGYDRSFLGRRIFDTLDKKVAGASFDVRNTGVGKSLAGYGLEMGTGKKGGYNENLKRSQESYERAANRMKPRDMTPEEEEEKKRAKTDHDNAIEQKKNADKARNEAAAVKESAILANTAAKGDRDAAQAEVDQIKESLWTPSKDGELRAAEIKLKDASDKLATAQNNLAKSTEDLAKAQTDLADADKNLIAKKKVFDDTEKKFSKGELTKEAKINYGEELKKSRFRSVREAGENIIKNAGMSKNERTIRDLLEGVENAGKKAKESTTDKTETFPKADS